MAGDSVILREYLVSLGFKVDPTKKKDFGDDLKTWDKAATKLAYSLTGVATAAVGMATEFAFRMERLYYASRLAESAAGNLQALSFGAKQSGIKDFTANVLTLARNIRANPGLQGLLNSLGVKVEGRDKADVLLDMANALSKMPFYVGQRYAALFGIDPDDLLLLIEAGGAIKKNAELQKEFYGDIGLDMAKAVAGGKEFAQTWREALMFVTAFKDLLVVAMLPKMQEFAAVMKEALKDWSHIVNGPGAGITPKGAAQSGLTVDEQKRVAERLADPAEQPKQKTWTAMTPDERKERGMPESDYGKPWTVWQYLTPEERAEKGLPKTEKDLPWDEHLTRFLTDTLRPKSGGAELTDSNKERLGQDRLRSTNPGWMRRKWDSLVFDTFGYRSRQKTPTDPQAVEEMTAPRRASDADSSSPTPPGAPTVPASVPPVPERELKRHPEEQAAMRGEETSRGLPPGLLDFMWRKESGRGQNLVSRMTGTGERSMGPFQFQPTTGKQYGLDDKSIMEFQPSMQAAAKMMQGLLAKYGGDLRYAMSAYNWGEGNMDKLLAKTMREHGDWSKPQVDDYVLGHVPEETRKYISGLGGGYDGAQAAQTVNINSDMKIDVHEATNAADVAKRIAENQQQVWSNVARDFSGKVR